MTTLPGQPHLITAAAPDRCLGALHDHLRVVLEVRIVDPSLDVKGMASRCATLDIEHRINGTVAMNDPEVIMSHAIRSSDLMVYDRAVEAAGEAIRLVKRTPAPLKCLADQVIRSASSVPANLAEGHGRLGRDRLHHWRIAYGSAALRRDRLRSLPMVENEAWCRRRDSNPHWVAPGGF